MFGDKQGTVPFTTNAAPEFQNSQFLNLMQIMFPENAEFMHNTVKVGDQQVFFHTMHLVFLNLHLLTGNRLLAGGSYTICNEMRHTKSFYLSGVY